MNETPPLDEICKGIQDDLKSTAATFQSQAESGDLTFSSLLKAAISLSATAEELQKAIDIADDYDKVAVLADTKLETLNLLSFVDNVIEYILDDDSV